MRLLLDTHLILWWQGMRDKVPVMAQELIQDSQDPVYVSRASLWEMAIKVGQGKLQLDLRRFCERIQADGFSWLPIENAHLLALATLPQFDDHKDPFERLLVAQSLSEPLILLTADSKLARYGVTVKLV
ncbi:MAG: PIN domain-containing protein [Proteobacteria bacterium ST_bin11]|nr:MAG: PIN domain-containing protein [Proteobacteria bacterium ST_bin11]